MMNPPAIAARQIAVTAQSTIFNHRPAIKVRPTFVPISAPFRCGVNFRWITESEVRPSGGSE